MVDGTVVSIVIPMYNCEKTIENTIQSILYQSESNCEIILVNDGSTDSTFEKALELKNKNENTIKLVSKKNGGVSSARNLGISLSKGKYICFLDSDDIYKKNFLKEMLLKAEKDDSDCVICCIEYTDINFNMEYGEDEIFVGDNIIAKNVPKLIEKKIFNSMVNKLYKKSIIDENNILVDEELQIGEDFDFNLKYVEKCQKVSVINKFLYVYQVEHSKLTNNYRENEYQVRKKNIVSLEKYYKKYDVKKDLNFQYIKIFYSELYNDLSIGASRKIIKYKAQQLLRDDKLKNIKVNSSSKVEFILSKPVELKNLNLIYLVSKISFKFKNNTMLRKKQISI
ncbi:glycosyltransferase family 2 protein [Vagococcus sp. CY52-2]|uniref:glycosyltransferase family 2 protein n=1 Tax=Vagococcus sp. CY52-2 TaxID=2925838 RepID=UPI001F5A2547|nr:glycosyltransferase family 2 protein [Vagococcus sp. CY52-2]UNM89968.1 glycosyltransferase [Vagococcus sp. CY52-2]